MSNRGIYRCPNCGALLTDKNAENCDYCGLTIDDNILTERGDERYLLHQGEVYFLKNLPGFHITIDTDNIPFQPEIIYDDLPISRLSPELREDAEEIISIVRKIERGCNEEDLDLCLSVISREHGDRRFYNRSRDEAIKQFITGDMKRHTVSIRFLSLTSRKARIKVKIEAIVFMDNGQIYQTEVGLVWFLRKYEGEWKLIKSSRREHKSLLRKGFKNIRFIVPVVITTAVIIGAIVSIILVIKGC